MKGGVLAGYSWQKAKAFSIETAGRQSGQTSAQRKRADSSQGEHQVPELASAGSQEGMETAGTLPGSHGCLDDAGSDCV